MLSNPAFFFNSELCTGCKCCMIACKDKHDLPNNVKWRRVVEFSGGEWLPMQGDAFEQNIFAYYISLSCNHCENPVCAKGCPTKAHHKDSNGIVSINQDLCVGCRYCEWNCPYGSPQFNPEIKKMSKCDFCKDNLEKGQAPACVAACPCRALDFGEYDDLVKKYGKFATIAPLPNETITNPHLICKPNRHSKPQGSSEGIRGKLVSNPEEV